MATTAPGDAGGALPAVVRWAVLPPSNRGILPLHPPSQRKSNFWVQSAASPALSLSLGLDPAGITSSLCHRDAAGSFHSLESPGSLGCGGACPWMVVGSGLAQARAPRAGWVLGAGRAWGRHPAVGQARLAPRVGQGSSKDGL